MFEGSLDDGGFQAAIATAHEFCPRRASSLLLIKRPIRGQKKLIQESSIQEPIQGNTAHKEVGHVSVCLVERKSPARKSPRKGIRPQLEQLEDRTVPAVFNVAAGDVGTLIADINQANSNGQSNTINLTAGTYDLTAANNNWYGPNGLPAITSNLTLNGNGACPCARFVAGPKHSLPPVLHLRRLDAQYGRGELDAGEHNAGRRVGPGRQ